MFGFLMADRDHLTPEQDARYRAAYCGLCRNLQSRYGHAAGLTLNYDMCFLVLLLQGLYEEEEKSESSTCLPHPFEARASWQCRFTDYAADMNLLLSWLKLLDNWEDDGNIGALAGAHMLRKDCEAIRKAYPRQAEAMERSLTRLHGIEKEKREAPDEAAGTFGELTGEMFVFREDRWAGALRAMGNALGRFLYVADAYTDLERDAVFGNYNPFRRYYGLPDNEARFRDLLKIHLGECLYYFDKLPIVQDTGLLQNILCFGLWSGLERKQKKKKRNTLNQANANHEDRDESNGIKSV